MVWNTLILFIGRKSARRRHALRDARRGILFGFYFPPQLVVDCIVFVPEETECFAVDKIFRFRKRNLAVADGRIFDEFSCSGIRSGVGNVVEVHFGNIRPAEEVDKFFCIFFVLCIFGITQESIQRFDPSLELRTPDLDSLPVYRWLLPNK